jgi:hypothetical protein
MPPIPVMLTETLASCAKAGQAGAAQTSPTNKTVRHDFSLAPGPSTSGKVKPKHRTDFILMMIYI